MSARPANVGILALEVCVGSQQVTAAELEVYDGVPGKYTKGLEQVALSCCSDCEDPVSLALSAVHSLLEKYAVDPRRIGRLDVGSESSPDRSKSIKSHVMTLIGGAGNHDVEGVDSVHGCYGGTAALFNSVNWVESSSWDGRLALVVATDVSAYEPKSSARATGGAGAVAMLVGPNAPLVVDPAWRASYSDNSSEFCKPAGTGLTPTFVGQATVSQYLKAMDCAFIYLHRRLQKLQVRLQEMKASGRVQVDAPFDVTQGVLPLVDHVLCHAPYVRLVRKAFARMALHDAVRHPNGDALLQAAGVPARWRVCEPDALPGAGYGDTALEKALLQATTQAFESKVMPGAWVQQQTGNTYTASLYMALAGLWERQGARLAGRRILLFSFGSGTVSTFFSIVGRQVPFGGEFTLAGGADKLQVAAMLQRRMPVSPSVYDATLQQMASAWGHVPLQPHKETIAALPFGSWYLSRVDEQHVRHYMRHKPSSRASSEAGAGQAVSPSTSTYNNMGSQATTTHPSQVAAGRYYTPTTGGTSASGSGSAAAAAREPAGPMSGVLSGLSEYPIT